jgi:hypothetical protein
VTAGLVSAANANSNRGVTFVCGKPDTNYTNCHKALDRFSPCGFVSGADGIGDTESKAATGRGERSGRQASFKLVSLFREKSKKKLAKISCIE